MRRGILSALAISAVAVPTLAIAAYSSPSSLMKAVQLQGKPMDVQYEFHGDADGTQFSAWLKGAVSAAKPKELTSVRAALRLTVDVATPEDGIIRVRTQIRMKNGTAYMQIEDVQDPSRSLMLFGANEHIGQWYSLSLDTLEESMTEEMAMQQEEVEAMVLKVLDSILSLQRTPEGNGSVYSLKLKRTAWKEIVPVITELAESQGTTLPEPTNKDLAEIRKFFSKLNLHIKVTTDAADAVTGLKFYAAAKDKEFSFVFQGTALVRATPVTVTVPRNAIDVSEELNPSYDDGEELYDAPATLEQARDAQRRSDVNTILSAVYQYSIDNNGALPAGITTVPTEVCRTGDATAYVDCEGLVDLSVMEGSYLYIIQSDPSGVEGSSTGYRIWKDQNGRVTVDAPGAEGGAAISVTR